VEVQVLSSASLAREQPGATRLLEPALTRRCNDGMRTPVVITALAAALVFPAFASAKGPDYALISGLGISGSIRIDGDGEGGTTTPLGALATYAGFATQVFGHHPKDPTAKRRPAGTLGARYRLVYSVPTPAGRSTIVADLYPFATPHPLTYMRPGQPFFNGMETHGGWYVAPNALKRTVLAAVSSGTEGSRSHIWRWTGISVGFAVLVLAAGLFSRRRPAPVPAP
jgi:hypothetical protein